MLFQTDYLIAWDFSEKGMPTVKISRLSSDKKSIHLTMDVLGVVHENCGVVSLRQIIENFEAEQRNKKAAAAPDPEADD